MHSASHLAWTAAGGPAHKYREQPGATHCATCAAAIESGVPLAQIDAPAMSNHGDYFRFGGGYVCPACAWLFGMGKSRPGNYIAIPGRYEEAVISLESVVESKRPWLAILRELAEQPGDTPACGVLTTDVKPRLWPRVRLATVGAFGLYVHAPDYDVSEYREFSLADTLAIVEALLPPLRAGFAKASCYFGLARDYARFSVDPGAAAAWEMTLAPLRSYPAFVPALIVAGVTQEEKKSAKPNKRK